MHPAPLLQPAHNLGQSGEPGLGETREVAHPACAGRSFRQARKDHVLEVAYPGVLLQLGVQGGHENRGLTPHIRDVARRLAKAGYAALALDVLSREGGTASLDSDTVSGALTGAGAPRPCS